MNFEDGISIAIKCLKLLLKKMLFKDYMYDKCLQFSKIYIGDDFSTYIKLRYGTTADSYCISEKDKIVSYDELKDCLLTSFSLKEQLINKLSRILNSPIIFYSCHLSNIGWIEYSLENNVNGYCNSLNRIEAIRCFSNSSHKSISYAVRTKHGDWLTGKNGKVAGTTGKSIPITAIKFIIEDINRYQIYYRVFIDGVGWSKWAKNGEIIDFNESIATAIQVKLTK